MMSAPCARLTILSTPQTRPMPSPIRPYNPPRRIPLTRIWPKRSTGPRVWIAAARAAAMVSRTIRLKRRACRATRRSPLRPARHRVERLPLEALAEDRYDLAFLDLDHRLRQRDLPVRLELDVAVE